MGRRMRRSALDAMLGSFCLIGSNVEGVRLCCVIIAIINLR